jgi:hypothetical protein
LQQLETLSIEQQEKVCQLAEDELRTGSSQLARVKTNLARETNESAKSCWKAIVGSTAPKLPN